MSLLFRCCILLLALSPFATLHAADPSPLGSWRTVDDESGKARAIVEISQRGDSLEGRITRLIREPDEDPHPLCRKCEGALKDQPIEGMTILTGLTRDGDEWSGGQILDPESGRVYRARMSLSPDGRELHVRGFIGISLIGRTQVWQRRD